MFARLLGVAEDDLVSFSLITGPAPAGLLDEAELVFIGGSGDYSVVRHWNRGVARTMEALHQRSKPTFGSCWGFQALARALGGEVVQDPAFAEVGFREFRLTAAGRRDPVFGGFADGRFPAVIGHEDTVTRLPPGAVRLASTDQAPNQAFVFRDRPIYGTQFHPELDGPDLIARLARYPRYIPLTGYPSLDDLAAALPPLTGAAALIRRFCRRFSPALGRPARSQVAAPDPRPRKEAPSCG